jgi:hypothetical protein
LERLEFQRSRIRLLGILLLSPVLVVASYFCTTLDDPVIRGVGWFGVCFFALAGIAVIAQIIRGGAPLVLSAEGIEDSRLGVGLIRWRDIADLRVTKVESSHLLCLRLVHPELYLMNLPTRKRALLSANRGMGFGDLAISFVGLRPGIDAALEFVRKVHESGDMGGLDEPAA